MPAKPAGGDAARRDGHHNDVVIVHVHGGGRVAPARSRDPPASSGWHRSGSPEPQPTDIRPNGAMLMRSRHQRQPGLLRLHLQQRQRPQQPGVRSLMGHEVSIRTAEATRPPPRFSYRNTPSAFLHVTALVDPTLRHKMVMVLTHRSRGQ
jgi:hypothetical protein